MRSLFSGLRARRGSNAVEFAVTLPVLLSLCVGVAEYGLFLQQAVDMVESSQAGASLAHARSEDVRDAAADYATAETAIRALAVSGCSTTASARGRGTTTCSATVDSSITDLGGPAVVVTATNTYSPISSGLIPVPAETTHTTTMALVGFF